jgi:hypothetical protein
MEAVCIAYGMMFAGAFLILLLVSIFVVKDEKKNKNNIGTLREPRVNYTGSSEGKVSRSKYKSQ